MGGKGARGKNTLLFLFSSIWKVHLGRIKDFFHGLHMASNHKGGGEGSAMCVGVRGKGFTVV